MSTNTHSKSMIVGEEVIEEGNGVKITRLILTEEAQRALSTNGVEIPPITKCEECNMEACSMTETRCFHCNLDVAPVDEDGCCNGCGADLGCTCALDHERGTHTDDCALSVREDRDRLRALVSQAADRIETAAELLAGDDEEDDRDAREFIAELRAAIGET